MAARTDAYNTGKDMGNYLNNTKLGQTVNKAAGEIGQSFVNYGKAINKAAQETVYGNIKSPEAVTGGALLSAAAKKSISSAARGGGMGLIGEFGVRAVKNIATDVFGYGK